MFGCLVLLSASWYSFRVIHGFPAKQASQSLTANLRVIRLCVYSTMQTDRYKLKQILCLGSCTGVILEVVIKQCATLAACLRGSTCLENVVVCKHIVCTPRSSPSGFGSRGTPPPQPSSYFGSVSVWGGVRLPFCPKPAVAGSYQATQAT